ncbi:MAG: sulfatase-like hydrolase/transferase [Terrimicrobiaceae bacterium]
MNKDSQQNPDRSREVSAAGRPPNILVLMTDEHRLSAIGCYGETPCRTPNIDRLAAKGVRFETCYTPCALCTPARASFLTGVYPHTHGMATNLCEPGCRNDEIPDSPMLLSRRLGELGYACGYTGKWHLGRGVASAHETAGVPTTRGFVGQDFVGHGSGGIEYPVFHDYVKSLGAEFRVIPYAKDGVKATGYGIVDAPPEASVPHFLANHTIELIDTFHAGEQPFFIWHNDWGPHGEHYVPQKYYDLYKDVEIPPWPNYEWQGADTPGPWQVKLHPNRKELEWDDWAEAVRHYYAMATQIDDEYGRILQHLEELGIADNTVVIFTSDHGATLGSHGGLTDKGWSHFEEIQRVGLIIDDPRPDSPLHQPGTVMTQFASLLDVYPTIIELAGGADPQKNVDGRSLVPLLRDPATPWLDSVVVEFAGLGSISLTMLSIRHGDIKYGWNPAGAEELYDLAEDPHEMVNRSQDPEFAQEVIEMRRRLYTFMLETRHPSANLFRQSRLGWTVDRHFKTSPDPLPVESLKTAVNW